MEAGMGCGERGRGFVCRLLLMAAVLLAACGTTTIPGTVAPTA